MTPEKTALVQESFKAVLPIAGPAADIFYDRLFETAPEGRPLYMLVADVLKQAAASETT